MPRIVTSIAVAATAALGLATVASAMQGVRTGNPPGPERPPAAAQSPMGQDAGMMDQMGEGMMRGPEMKGQMGKMTGDCPCCQRMAEMDRGQPKRR